MIVESKEVIRWWRYCKIIKKYGLGINVNVRGYAGGRDYIIVEKI